MSVPAGANLASTVDRTSTAPLADLTAALQASLTGPANVGATAVVWSDRGSQILLDVAHLHVTTVPGALVVGVDTSTVEHGSAPLIVRFVLGQEAAGGALVASTDADALGHPDVAARWGALFRDVVWAALLRYVDTHARAQGLRAASLAVRSDSSVEVAARPDFSLVDLAATVVPPLATAVDPAVTRAAGPAAGGPRTAGGGPA